jgi:hypothetical protein
MNVIEHIIGQAMIREQSVGLFIQLPALRVQENWMLTKFVSIIREMNNRNKQPYGLIPVSWCSRPSFLMNLNKKKVQSCINILINNDLLQWIATENMTTYVLKSTQ